MRKNEITEYIEVQPIEYTAEQSISNQSQWLEDRWLGGIWQMTQRPAYSLQVQLSAGTAVVWSLAENALCNFTPFMYRSGVYGTADYAVWKLHAVWKLRVVALLLSTASLNSMLIVFTPNGKLGRNTRISTNQNLLQTLNCRNLPYCICL